MGRPTPQADCCPTRAHCVSLKKLAGKVIAQKPLNNNVIQAALWESLEFCTGLAYRRCYHNTFLFHFTSEVDREKVFLSCPWNVQGYLLVLKPWNPDYTFQEMCWNVYASLCGFWTGRCHYQSAAWHLQKSASGKAIKAGTYSCWYVKPKTTLAQLSTRSFVKPVHRLMLQLTSHTRALDISSSYHISLTQPCKGSFSPTYPHMVQRKSKNRQSNDPEYCVLAGPRLLRPTTRQK